MTDNDVRIFFEFLDEVAQKLNLSWFDLIAFLELYKHEVITRMGGVEEPQEPEINPDDLTDL